MFLSGVCFQKKLVLGTEWWSKFTLKKKHWRHETPRILRQRNHKISINKANPKQPKQHTPTRLQKTHHPPHKFQFFHQASGGVGKKTRRADKNSVADFPGSSKSSSVKSPMMVKLMIPRLAPVKLNEIELSLSHSKRALTVKLFKLDQDAWGAKIFNALVPKCDVSFTAHLFKGDGNLLKASLMEGSRSLAKLLAIESDKCGHKCSRTPFNAKVSSVNGLERTALTNWSRNLVVYKKSRLVIFFCLASNKKTLIRSAYVCTWHKYIHNVSCIRTIT